MHDAVTAGGASPVILRSSLFRPFRLKVSGCTGTAFKLAERLQVCGRKNSYGLLACVNTLCRKSMNVLLASVSRLSRDLDRIKYPLTWLMALIQNFRSPMSKILLKSALWIAGIYLLGFFLLTPLMISSNGTLARPIIESLNHNLYITPISSMAPENPIAIVWRANSRYWCEKLSGCTVDN